MPWLAITLTMQGLLYLRPTIFHGKNAIFGIFCVSICLWPEQSEESIF